MKIYFQHLLPMILLVCASSANAADPSGSIEQGKQLYMKNSCYTCHGTIGQGGERNAGPKIAPNPFPFVAFEMQLRQPRAVMPRYPVQFVSNQDLADIYSYVASIPAGPDASTIALLNRF
jgi:ubiquinol-cytochrome c reductase cytochrome c subunit